jgi:hypothetical protein
LQTKPGEGNCAFTICAEATKRPCSTPVCLCTSSLLAAATIRPCCCGGYAKRTNKADTDAAAAIGKWLKGSL